MPDTYKILGQVNATTEYAALYFVPMPASLTYGPAEPAPFSVSAQTQTLVTSIIVCNWDPAPADHSFYIAVQAGSESPETQNTLFSDAEILQNSSKVLSLGLTLAEGDYIMVKADAALISFTAMGIEVT